MLQCYEESVYCNGESDCSDNSDEPEDCIATGKYTCKLKIVDGALFSAI